VIGVGNVLCRDEGVGVHVVEELRSRSLPPGVEVIDAGTAVVDVLLDTSECRKIVIVDAVLAGGRPGDTYRLPLSELSRVIQKGTTSLHEISLLGSINMAALQLQQMPEIVVIGVEPQEVGPGAGLSWCLRDRLETIQAAVLEEVACGPKGEP
jgi:hydrogenase maturation protease